MINVIAVLEVRDKEAFAEFESRAMLVLRSHGGELISAFESDPNFSSSSANKEIHYLQFPSIEEFTNYRNDPELATLSELREKAISSTEIFVSDKLKDYS